MLLVLQQSWGFARDVSVTPCLGEIPLKILSLGALGVPWGYRAYPPYQFMVTPVVPDRATGSAGSWTSTLSRAGESRESHSLGLRELFRALL